MSETPEIKKLHRKIRRLQRADTEFRRATSAGEQPRQANAGTAFRLALWSLFDALPAERRR